MTKEEIAKLLILKKNSKEIINAHAQILKKGIESHKDEILDMVTSKRKEREND